MPKTPDSESGPMYSLCALPASPAFVLILVFGFSSTLLIITNDVSYNQFEALSYVIENQQEQSTILASPTYSWILYDVDRPFITICSDKCIT